MSNITIYTTPNCKNCEKMKRALETKGYNYNTEDLSNPDISAEILLSGCSIMSSPIVKIGDNYYTMQGALNILQ